MYTHEIKDVYFIALYFVKYGSPKLPTMKGGREKQYYTGRKKGFLYYKCHMRLE
jgi:hypothetical protein